MVFFVQMATELSWRTHPQGIRFDDCLLRNQSPSGNDGAGADDDAIEDDASHPDQAALFDFAAMENGAVAYGDVVAEEDAVFLFHAVEDTVVLNVGIVADADLMDIAAENSVHPDAGVLADDHVSDELGGVVDVGGIGELGSDAFEGADHIRVRLSDLRCELKTYHGQIAEVRPEMTK
jgi:hypothetical protein